MSIPRPLNHLRWDISTMRCGALLCVVSMVFLGGCVSAPVMTTQTQLKTSGNTYLSGETAKERQEAVNAASEKTQSTGNSRAVIVEKPRVFWMGVYREGDDVKWGSDSLVKKLEGKLKTGIEEAIASAKPQAIDLLTLGGGSKIESSDGLVAVLAISSESRSWQPHPYRDTDVYKRRGWTHRAFVDIRGQLLFIDSKIGRVNAPGGVPQVGWQVTASYPLAVRMEAPTAGVPSDDSPVWLEIATEALVGTARAANNAALSIRDQMIDQLQSDSITPRGRSGVSPVAAAPAVIKFGAAEAIGASINEADAVRWSDDLGSTLSRYLAAGTGLVVSPYVPSGAAEIRLSPILGGAVGSFSKGQGDSVLSAVLQRPGYVFELQVEKLTLADSSVDNPELAVLRYGFSGRLVLKRPEQDGLKETHSWPIQLPLPPSDKTGKQWEERTTRYLKGITVNLQRSTLALSAADLKQMHLFWWRRSFEQSLFHLSRELLFPKDDLTGLFRDVRKSMVEDGLFNAEISGL